MLQFAPSSSLPLPVASSDRADGGWCDPILSFAGVVTGSHALVISRNGLDLMCCLLRYGCTAVTTLKPSERVNGETYDLVLASSTVSTGTAGGLVHQAKRDLLPGGRFLAVVPAASTAANPSAPAMLVRLLKADGFICIRSRPMQNGLLVRADLPVQDAFRAASISMGMRA